VEVDVAYAVVYVVTLLAQTLTIWTSTVGPDALYTATVPGLSAVVPVTELKKLQSVPLVEAVTHAVNGLQTSMHI
jgi:hypothetical protein